jgi:diguanylate cyclase (GGDEF)-like protein
MKSKWIKQKRYKWALIGSSLSFIGPLGEWLFLKLFYLADDRNFALTYLYMELWTLLCFSSFGYFLGRSAEKIEHIAFHDPLTGVISRRYLMQQFQELLGSQTRYNQTFSTMMLDLDHFKNVNDNFGHLIGDKCLIAAAKCMTDSCRKIDVVGRYGGEEFIILCPNTNQTDVMHLAERVRLNISTLSEKEIGYPGPLTVSIGLFTIFEGAELSINYVIGKLDSALYAAKHNGRNQTNVATTMTSPD